MRGVVGTQPAWNKCGLGEPGLPFRITIATEYTPAGLARRQKSLGPPQAQYPDKGGTFMGIEIQEP
jgi:hypothetical protein